MKTTLQRLLLALTLLSAVASTSQAAIQADYETDIIGTPESSLAHGWTYFITPVGFTAGTYNPATLDPLKGWWDAALKTYNTYNPPVYMTIALNGSGGILPGDGGQAFVARWTSDVAASSATITGTFNRVKSAPAPNGASQFLVSINGAPPVEVVYKASTDTTVKSYSYTLPSAIAVGTTIELIVNGIGNNWFGHTVLTASITTSP